MKLNKRITAVVAVVIAAAATLTGCSGVSTPEAMCAFVVHDGQEGRPSTLHKVLLPGETISEEESRYKNIRYVPCNERNYKINDGSVKVNQGDKEVKVGDRFTPSLAYTKSGTPVQVWSDSYWTLNQTRELLKNTFYSACYKYTCFSTDKTGGAANFSTAGWNGMLAENFGPTIDEIALQAVAEMDDNLFSALNSAQRVQLGEKMSALFNASMQRKFGTSENIFCGSGNSKWIAKDKNPYDKFECTQVRIDIPRVYRYVPTSNEAASNPESQAKLNAERLRLAKELYGDAAGTWLGYQDTIQKCKDAGVPCNLYLGAIPKMN